MISTSRAVDEGSVQSFSNNSLSHSGDSSNERGLNALHNKPANSTPLRERERYQRRKDNFDSNSKPVLLSVPDPKCNAPINDLTGVVVTIPSTSPRSIKKRKQMTDSIIARFLAHLSCGEAWQAMTILDEEAVTLDGILILSKTEATTLLLRCVDDPDALAEPLETIRLLIDRFHANINAVTVDGRNSIHAVFANSLLGKFLISRGADVLMSDYIDGSCALSLSFEYQIEYLYNFFVSSGGEADLLSSGDENNQERKLRYIKCLLIAGYATKLNSWIFDSGIVTITTDMATELLLQCKENFDNMKEPVETFELLERLGAQC
jgi:hypothetical protein